MQTFSFTIEIPAITKAEAQAKLDLMLQIGAFAWDMDANKLTKSVLAYWTLTQIGKGVLKSLQKSEALQAK